MARHLVLVVALLSGILAPVTRASQSRAAPDDGRKAHRYSTVKQWKADVIVTSDCDRVGADGSKTIVHNRIATTYDFTRRRLDAQVPTWAGRATTTYRWSVGMEFRGTRDAEESAATFESDGTLTLAESTRIASGRAPGRPFTRKRYLGDTLVDTSTANDEPPVADLSEAPLPADDGSAVGNRMEEGYALMGGLLLPCPAQRQWTIRAIF